MSYSRGRRFEWIVKGLFESRGWVTVRAARSKPIDLVALKDGRILLIECKYNAGVSQRRRELLMDLARRAGARPILATKKRHRKGVKLIDLTSGGELSIEEISDDDPDCDPDRDLAYYMRERGRLICRIEPSYTIIVNDAR